MADELEQRDHLDSWEFTGDVPRQLSRLIDIIARASIRGTLLSRRCYGCV